ncbi:MAG: hypothetical protein R3252_03540, partial [Robiginitalea sp.]|nr:hypothetical protein [Robiginitalea sp.]
HDFQRHILHGSGGPLEIVARVEEVLPVHFGQIRLELAGKAGKTLSEMSLAEMDQYWEAAKRQE